MVSTTDEPSPVLASEDNSTHQQAEIQVGLTVDAKKLKEALNSEVRESPEQEEVETEPMDDGDKENGDCPETEETSPTTSAGSPSANGVTNGSTNGSNHMETKKENSNEVECIDLDEEDDVKEVPVTSTDEPPAKKAKTEDADIKVVEKTDKKEPELNSPEALLNKLQDYVADAIDTNKNVDRKVLDALLGAINVQVQKEPLSVRKLILEKKLVLPNTISFPPSDVVNMLIEHDPEFPLSKVISRMFGEERPKLSDAEKKERQQLKAHNPAPHMTKLLMDIGQDLVQEATYCDIVHAKNLPETPKNIDTYKTVAAQLKPVWEALRKKNEPYKMKLLSCQVCGFKTESRIVLQNHRSTTHYRNGKYQCAMCPDYDTNEQRLLSHYLESHMVIASKEEPQAKYPCLICEEDFQFKGIRDQHMKACKKDYSKVRHIMAPKGTDDLLMINRWLWDRPPIDPTILQQQQAAQAQQKKQQQIQQATAQSALRRNNLAGTTQAALLQQQLLQQQRNSQQSQQQQQQLRQLGALMQNRGLMGNNNLIAAMQQHLQRTANANRNTSTSNMPSSPMYQKGMNKNMNAAALMGAAAQLRKQFPQMNKNLTGSSASLMASMAAAVAGNSTSNNQLLCEICDQQVPDKEKYLSHLQMFHKQMKDKATTDMQQGAPLACSRCKERFWTYEGLERHLVMSHGLVTADLLQKAQKKEDGGRCKLCGKQYAFNMLQHLVADHQVKLCSAEIMYSCDVCSFKCTSYRDLESHLSSVHPKGDKDKEKAAQNGKKNGDDCITLDD